MLGIDVDDGLLSLMSGLGLQLQRQAAGCTNINAHFTLFGGFGVRVTLCNQ